MPIISGGKVIEGARANVFAQPAPATLTATSGAADDTIQDVGAAFNQATLNNNFRDLSARFNALIAALQAAGVLS